MEWVGWVGREGNETYHDSAPLLPQDLIVFVDDVHLCVVGWVGGWVIGRVGGWVDLLLRLRKATWFGLLVLAAAWCRAPRPAPRAAAAAAAPAVACGV